MSENVTMRHIARAAGVAPSTVSKALRDDPTISTRLCAEIRRLAQTLGYHPHPMVSTLMAQLHGSRRRNDPYHIAWIELWAENKRSKLVSILKPIRQGAEQRAKELGYQIQVYRTPVESFRIEGLRKILLSRTQWGLIFPPVPVPDMHLPFDLRGLTAVTIGTSLHHPVMHRVSPNHYQSGQLACERLRSKGFRRIGIVLSPDTNERVEGKWLAAYLGQQQLWPAGQRLPPLLVNETEKELFDGWLRQHKPDSILVAEPYLAAWLTNNHLKNIQPRLAWLVVDLEKKNIWGIDYRAEQIGMAAVELLVGQIHRNERGSPKIPHTLLLDGIWVEH